MRTWAGLLALVVGLTACNPTGNPAPTPEALAADQTLSFPTAQDISDFDPALISSAADVSILRNVFSGLYRFDQNLREVPDLAVGQPMVSSDRPTYTFRIRQDGRFSNGLDGIAISKSTDQGLTWSSPLRVNGVATTQAFTPSIAVAQGGAVGVTYYDLRNDNPSDSDHLLATRWLASSHDGGATFTDTAMSSTFDIRSAPTVSEGGQSGYFLGDYQGLVSAGTSFLPFFVIANTGNTGNRSDVFARPITSGPAVVESFSSTLVVPRRVRGGPRRVF